METVFELTQREHLEMESERTSSSSTQAGVVSVYSWL